MNPPMERSGPKLFRLDEKLPEENVRVIVVCRDYRCLGYLDKGIWRHDHGGRPITEPIVGWTT